MVPILYLSTGSMQSPQGARHEPGASPFIIIDVETSSLMILGLVT